MKNLIVFGDSFSTVNYCVDVDQSFYGLIAKKLDVDQILNYSWCGNDLTTIKHLIVNEMSRFSPENDYVIVGIPPIERVTLYDHDDPDSRNYNFNIVDRGFQVSNQHIDTLSGTMTGPLMNMIPGYVPLYDRSWYEAMALTDIILLHSFIKSLGFKFIIANLGQPFTSSTQWPTLQTLITKTSALDNIIVFDDTYYSVNYQKNIPVDYDRYGWFGHHGSAGNELWYKEILEPLIYKLNWVQ